VRAYVAEQYRLWKEEIAPQLPLVSAAAATAEQKAVARAHFTAGVFPALTPLAVDPGHPFPFLRNKTLNLAVLLRKGVVRKKARSKASSGDTSLAVVQVPSVLPRVVPVSGPAGKACMLLEELIAENVGDLFPGFTVVSTTPFRVTRNSDLNLDEEDSEDLLSTVQEELRRRERGAAVRLEIGAAAPADLEKTLREVLNLGADDVYRIPGPLALSEINAIGELDARPELRVEPLVPQTPVALQGAESLFPIVAARDVLLHHPYESFEPVVRLVEEAADDPAVLCIKMTLYRTTGDSPIARALSRAAENGKQVAVLIEIKARLDEANNIAWARKLEETGVHVVYGLIGLKTHCKVLLVVRREGNGIRRYVHLGTGNYNTHTARQYTDLSLFSARPELADDVTALFNMLTGYADPPQWKRIAVAPLGLQERVVGLIDREAARAKKGEPARIIAKMNALVDPVVIKALYAASAAGVEIDLCVRGICCLRPGVPGVSERIRVTSVVDRFLEHTRIFAFGAGPGADVFLSSADWMPRNFHRRVEVLYPIEDPALKTRCLDEILGAALRDNMKARRLSSSGTYEPVVAEGPPVRSQTQLLELARRAGEPKSTDPIIRQAVPVAVKDEQSGPVATSATV
jgi:polyphosphate kinase